MLGFLLLLGISPPVGPDATARSGPPAVHRAWTAECQWALADRADVRAFRARWSGAHNLRFDETTGSPRFLWAPGTPLSAVQALVADLARLSGIDPAELSAQAPVQRGDRSFLRWTRSWRGAEVLGDQVLVIAQDGRVAGVWLQLSPIGLRDRPRPGEQVLPLPRFPAG